MTTHAKDEIIAIVTVVVREIGILLAKVLEISGFRGSIIIILDIDSDAKSVKFKSRLFPTIEI